MATSEQLLSHFTNEWWSWGVLDSREDMRSVSQASGHSGVWGQAGQEVCCVFSCWDVDVGAPATGPVWVGAGL